MSDLRDRVAPVSVSSAAAQVGGIAGPHHAASKAGLIGLAHGCAAGPRLTRRR